MERVISRVIWRPTEPMVFSTSRLRRSAAFSASRWRRWASLTASRSRRSASF